MNWKEFWAKVRQIWEDSSGYLSAKRVFGSIGFICAIIMAFNKVPVDVIIAILSPSCVMIGLDSVTDIWKQPVVKPDENKVVEHEIAG